MANVANNREFNEYAVIDLGSNSFHIIIARINSGSLQVIYKNKQNIQLATGLNDNSVLNDSSVDRGITCLALFAERVKGFPLSNIRIIGTHTLRVARNRHQFLTAAAKVIPYPIEIISGQEEARLIYLGAINTESAKQSEVKCIIDIGGGSTEIAIGVDSTPTLVDSRPMGCVTYGKQFFPQQKYDKHSFERAKLAAELQVEKIVNLVKKQNVSVAFGSSGTIKSIYSILLDIGVTDGIITPKRLEDLTAYILEHDSFDQIDYPSLSEERKHVFVSGLAIFCGVFNAFELKELHYCQSALREGVLYEMTGNSGHHDVRQNTAISLSKQYCIDQKHANQVVITAKRLFGQWKRDMQPLIDESLESILYWAALLHEVGLHINFSGIHKHSAYILQNSNMPGFNEEQQQLLSILVRYHRKAINFDNIPYFSLFESQQIFPLLQILRLSVLINNQRSSSINLHAFTLKRQSGELTKIDLLIDADFARQNRLILLDLEQEQRYWQQHKNWQLTVKLTEQSA